MDQMRKDRLFCHVRMATGQNTVEQKFVEECSELIKDVSNLQMNMLKGERFEDDDIKSTLEQVTGESDALAIVGVAVDAKLDRLHQRAVDGELKTNMAWQQ